MSGRNGIHAESDDRDAAELRRLDLAIRRRMVDAANAERARREGVVVELERGAEAAILPDMARREVAIAKLRPPWWRRAINWFAARFRRGGVYTRGMGFMSRKQHGELVRFARESGNAAMLECLRTR